LPQNVKRFYLIKLKLKKGKIKMTITAAMVAELREKTGLGMMDCKKSTDRSGRRYGACD